MQGDQPMYSDENDGSESRYRSVNPDVGRVYIFYGKPQGVIGAGYMDGESEINSNDKNEYMQEPPVILRGPRKTGGRFGHVVLSAGDLDGDGIDDIAVSCPFCQDSRKSSDKGAVYVYLGRKNAKIKDEPDQVSFEYGNLWTPYIHLLNWGRTHVLVIHDDLKIGHFAYTGGWKEIDFTIPISFKHDTDQNLEHSIPQIEWLI